MTYAAYDDQAIWGTGETPDAALADARNWLDHTRPDEHDAAIARMHTGPMTPALAARVAEFGGDEGFVLLAGGQLVSSSEVVEQIICVVTKWRLLGGRLLRIAPRTLQNSRVC